MRRTQGGTFEDLRWKKEQLHELKQMRIRKEEERLQDDPVDLESPPPLAESCSSSSRSEVSSSFPAPRATYFNKRKSELQKKRTQPQVNGGACGRSSFPYVSFLCFLLVSCTWTRFVRCDWCAVWVSPQVRVVAFRSAASWPSDQHFPTFLPCEPCQLPLGQEPACQFLRSSRCFFHPCDVRVIGCENDTTQESKNLIDI